MASGRLFQPYLASSLDAIKQGTSYFHEDVREQAYLALPGLTHVAQPSTASSSGATLMPSSQVFRTIAITRTPAEREGGRGGGREGGREGDSIRPFGQSDL